MILSHIYYLLNYYFYVAISSVYYVVSLYCISALYSAAKAAGILGIYHLSCFLIVYMINKAMITKKYIYIYLKWIDIQIVLKSGNRIFSINIFRNCELL